jgi:hypothetical protein
MRLRFGRWAYFCLFLVSLGLNSSVKASDFSTEKLLGKSVRHDGPNCFNGALLAVGFMNMITYTDQSEFQLYVQTFCEEVDTPADGSLIGVVQNGYLTHAVVRIDASVIFEKFSVYGSEGIKSSLKESTYQVRQLDESSYLNGCGDGCEARFYSCDSAETVQSQTTQCESSNVYRLISNLRAQASAGLFDGNLTQYRNDAYLLKLEELTKILIKLKSETFCDRLVIANAFSLLGQYLGTHKEKNFDSRWQARLNKFGFSLQKMFGIWARDKSSETQRLLHEANWISDTSNWIMN